MKVLIYADEGVGQFSLQETLRTFRECYTEEVVETVDHEFLLNSDWEKETSLIIIPGGRDIPYDRKLRGKGTAKIRNFVEGGGSYLGICAGAYFGSGEVIFEKGTALEVHEKRELCFFPGEAVGTLYPNCPFVYNSKSGSCASSIALEHEKGEIINLYYNGGCAFKEAQSYPGISVLARYHDADDQPAIIHCKIGKGNAILSGVHFEVSPEKLEEDNSEEKMNMIDSLKRSDKRRESLVTFLISLLN
eukprot:Tbor_TRINITY_DN4291_c0_g1::TRINITY_DN4291_c0_g1_i1::g.23906::m.23906/K01942/HLCS; biotin--protein ligase